MIVLTAVDIVRFISQLPRNRVYSYVSSSNKGLIEISDVILPEGPIIVKRYNPSKGESRARAENVSISSQMIWRISNAFTPEAPINFDRVLGASYNTRSILEALMAHCPQFYTCNPGRIESNNSSSNVKPGHKHLLWCPDDPHPIGEIVKRDTQIVISEVPANDVVYESLTLPDMVAEQAREYELDIDVRRRHAQIQIALVRIGQELGFRTWVAHNDRGIVYKDKSIGELPGVVSALRDQKLMSSFEEAQRNAHLIDVIWFRNSKFMPAVMEIEHSTGVISGLTRMKNFQDSLPPFPTRYVIVAADEYRSKVMRDAAREQFQSLETRFFPYSAVEELYSLVTRRKIRGVTDDFLDSYMEPVSLGLLH